MKRNKILMYEKPRTFKLDGFGVAYGKDCTTGNGASSLGNCVTTGNGAKYFCSSGNGVSK